MDPEYSEGDFQSEGDQASAPMPREADSEPPTQQPSASEAAPNFKMEAKYEVPQPSVQEVVSMASYLGVDLKGGEHYLLGIAREAVMAEVLPPWEEMEDEHGNPYFYNHSTKESTRRHPLDTSFLDLIGKWRRQYSGKYPEATFMRFRGSDGVKYYHNFASDSTEEVCPHGKEIPSVPLEEIPRYEVPDANDIEGGPRVTTKQEKTRWTWRPQAHHKFSVRELVFKSWWLEDKEEETLGNNHSAGGGLKKRYVTVRFDIYQQTFEVHLNNEEAVSLYNLTSVTAKHGMPVQCWDLHVGAKLNLLGKTTTLMQGSLETIHWLEYHAKRLRAVKAELEKELRKYETHALAPAVVFEKGSKTKGGASLRALMDQIEKLRGLLAAHRPALAEKLAAKAIAEP
mmetsp:Transcript_17026/g.20518  ORF Transcript_17026/g.20518 Transcript_17026/m.20518 type:complete len:398 (-) Transcript_17026:193-1386(-)|eukprot:CAMPEP_0197865972 /NCGR_PEP_ID=MMETSP1438-20131217/43963_1 /TAXON_ID=1461541 /ORGANISM="Pterosperma sp., Strain CCMP1384" /LENGTH=397 /DNA_ID=CAMNT_0043484497 /DNA_START=60 /DNA_END=1253 /DNA_ORIENTATION=+